jgi:hypothetical protein
VADGRARGWGDAGQPGSPQAATFRRQHIVTIDVGGIRINVNRRAARLFAGFIQAITSQGYDLTGHADDWGYASRYIRGFETERILSNHAWGLAVDLNAVDHPLGQHGTGLPPFVVAEAERWGLFWGGLYQGRPDEMHFEFLGTPADVARYPLQQEDDVKRHHQTVIIGPSGMARAPLQINVPHSAVISATVAANSDGSFANAVAELYPSKDGHACLSVKGDPGQIDVIVGYLA